MKLENEPQEVTITWLSCVLEERLTSSMWVADFNQRKMSYKEEIVKGEKRKKAYDLSRIFSSNCP